MSLLFFDGFETYKTTRESRRIWKTLTINNFNMSQLDKHTIYENSAYTMRFDYVNANHDEMVRSVNAKDNEFIIGFGFKILQMQQESLSFEADNTIYTDFCRLFDDIGSLIGSIWIHPYWGKIGLARSTSTTNDSSTNIYGSSFNVIQPGTYYYIEFKGSVSSNATFTLRIDGETIATVTGVNTTNASTIPKRLRTLSFRAAYPKFAPTEAWVYLIDNVYICDGTGTRFNDFIGPSFVRRMQIVSEKINQWSVVSGSTSVSAISDGSIDSYIETATTSASAVFSLGGINVSNITALKAIKIDSKLQKTISVPSSAVEIVEVSGIGRTERKTTPSITHERQFRIYETRPDGTDWQPSDLNNLYLGIKRK